MCAGCACSGKIDPAEVAQLVRAGDLNAAMMHEYDLIPSEPDLALATEPMHLATRRRVTALARWPTVTKLALRKGEG
jgi:hypothetical protein